MLLFGCGSNLTVDHAIDVAGYPPCTSGKGGTLVTSESTGLEVTVNVNIARTQEEADIQAGKAAPVEAEEAADPESDEFTRGSGFDELDI